MVKYLAILVVMCISCGGTPSSPNPVTVVKPSSPTAPADPSQPAPSPPSAPTGGWSETFSGALSARWIAQDYTGINNTVFDPAYVDLSSGLTLKLVVDRSLDGAYAVKRGAEVQSVDRYGFGTYTWIARTSHAADGSVGSGHTDGMFVYAPGSVTEIDFEQEGQFPDNVHAVVFKDGRSLAIRDAKIGAPWSAFHTYSFEWSSTRITWSVDGQQVAVQDRDVPQTPGVIIMNHWAGQGWGWGGVYRFGEPLYFTVRSFSFVPR